MPAPTALNVSGTFDVQGQASIIIQLPWQPAAASVAFSDQDPFVNLPSCDLVIGDQLSFKIVKEVKKFTLQIAWSVKGTRTVQWNASKS